jgi:hypothetical protein
MLLDIDCPALTIVIINLLANWKLPTTLCISSRLSQVSGKGGKKRQSGISNYPFAGGGRFATSLNEMVSSSSW